MRMAEVKGQIHDYASQHFQLPKMRADWHICCVYFSIAQVQAIFRGAPEKENPKLGYSLLHFHHLNDDDIIIFKHPHSTLSTMATQIFLGNKNIPAAHFITAGDQTSKADRRDIPSSREVILAFMACVCRSSTG